jgi:hypothetical protein
LVGPFVSQNELPNNFSAGRAFGLKIIPLIGQKLVGSLGWIFAGDARTPNFQA